MRKLILSAFIFFKILEVQGQVKPSKGYGTKGSPYQIETLDHLRWLSEGIKEGMSSEERGKKHYILSAAIDATETKEWNEGKGFKPIAEFKGSFNGNDNKITNLYIKRPDEYDIGLFATLSHSEDEKEGEICTDLTLENVDFVGKNNIGGLAGYTSRTTIRNIEVTGKIKGEDNVGGLFGSNSSTVVECKVKVQVEGEKTVGGLAGVCVGKFENCMAFGSVKGKKEIGGLVGQIRSQGSIFGSGSGELRSCYAANRMKGESDIGGLVGAHNLFNGTGSRDYKVFSCFWDKTLSGQLHSVGSDDSSGISTEQFSERTSLEAWNFNNVWVIKTWNKWDENPRPYLQKDFFSIKINAGVTSAYLDEQVSFKGNRWYNEGDEVSLQINPLPGYEFKGWYMGNKLISDQNPMIFQLKESSPLVYWAKMEPVDNYGFTGGEGTKEKPYQISSIEQLAILSYTPVLWDRHFELVKDIDASITREWHDGKGFYPIGKMNYNGAFSGQFIGNQFKIKNLHILREDDWGIGLFHIIGHQAEVREIEFSNSKVVGRNLVGTLSGRNMSSNVSEIVVHGFVKGIKNVGGITGANFGRNDEFVYGTIRDCIVMAEIYGVRYVAGISEGSGTIINCYSFSKMKGPLEKEVFGIGGKTNYSSFWDKDFIGVDWSRIRDKDHGVSSSFFSDQNNFSDWDFEKNWVVTSLEEYDENPRPYLSWMVYNARINIEESPIEGLKSKSGDAFYNYGETVTLKVDPSNGYRFVKWEVNGEEISLENPYRFVLNQNSSKRYVAVFEEDINFAGGSGTSSDPFQIETIEQLAQLSYLPSLWDQNYILNNDIDASETTNWNKGAGFLPIGKTGRRNSAVESFKGKLNGNHFTISNLVINQPDSNYVGLFRNLKGTVENLRLVKVKISGNDYVGALAGRCNEEAIISDIKINGTVLGENYVGGLAGSSNALGEKLGVKGEVEGKDYVGGLFGSSNNTISRSYSIASVKGKSYVGGFVGSSTGKFLDSFTQGKVTGESYIGGFIGKIRYYALAERCYASGRVHGNSKVGGFIGDAHDSYGNSYESENAYWDKWTTNQERTAGIQLKYGMTTDEFGLEDSFNGWDFDDVWEIKTKEGFDEDPRPYLRWLEFDTEIKLMAASPYEKAIGVLEGAGFYNFGDKVTLTAKNGQGYAFDKWTLNGVELTNEPTYSFVLEQGDNLVYEADFKEVYSFSGGDGSVENPFLISTIEELAQLGIYDTLKDRSYKLIDDIDASKTKNWNSGEGFLPIGSTSRFTGTFNGNGHVISHLFINNKRDFSGVFSYVSGEDTRIEKLGIVDLQLQGGKFVGGLVGGLYANAVVDQCYVSGHVEGSYITGGLVGNHVSEALIKNCFSMAYVNGHDNVGGLVGYKSVRARLENSYAAGEVKGVNFRNTGGLVGNQGYSGGPITSSYWDKETTKQTKSDYSDEKEGLFTYQFLEKDHFVDWDFENVWVIRNVEQFGQAKRPFLRCQFLKNIVATAEQEEQGTVAGTGTYLLDEQVQLEAQPTDGYNFVEWKMGKESFSTDNPLSLLVKDHVTLVAVFEPKIYEITLTHSTGGTVSEIKSDYKHGEELVLRLYPEEDLVVSSITLNEERQEGELIQKDGYWEFKTIIESGGVLKVNFGQLLNASNSVPNQRIFPNPFTNELNVTLNEAVNLIILKNLHGQEIIKSYREKGDWRFDTSFLASGVFILTINERSYRIIKN
ncbi:MAG: T9SS type A sorting domain-containing protein [Desulfovibrionales bacterium]|nr:T9SS type A sorting domain-containing protein [Desulfovibrionales bacterium]